MIKEYAKIEIRKSKQETKDTTSYYILEEEKFGLKILKSSNNEKAKDQEIIIHNISEKEEVVENILDTIIENSSDTSQTSYIIDDLLEQYNIKEGLKNQPQKQSLV